MAKKRAPRKSPKRTPGVVRVPASAVAVDSPYDGVVVMTREEHSDFVASGCDPHCHACGRGINVGDRWAFKTFFDVGDDLGIRIRGTCCERCVIDERGLSPIEMANLQTRLQAAAAKRTAPAPEKPAEPKPPTRHGCFVLDDGTRF